MVMVLAPDKRAKQSSEARQHTEDRHRVATNGNAPDGTIAMSPAAAEVSVAELSVAEPVEAAAAPVAVPATVPAEAALEQVETHP